MKARRMFGWLVGISAAVTLTAVASPVEAAPSTVTAAGPLVDLSPAMNATDGARAQVHASAPGNGKTYFVFVVRQLDLASQGRTYGAHVHVGPCVPGNGAAALGHYNTGEGGSPSPQNEVWLDFTVRPGGVAVSRAIVPFEIPPGKARSIVIHANPTEPGTGAAGGRIACLPVEF